MLERLLRRFLDGTRGEGVEVADLPPMSTGETDVRTVKLAVSMPGDYENGLLGPKEDEADQIRPH